MAELMNQDDNRNKPVNLCWYVGAQWSEDGDLTNQFIKDGVWMNGFEDKLLDEVKSIKVGDKIAIKSSCIQKNNLPFDINNGTASLMKIKVVGTVTENKGDGRHLVVDWEKPFDKPKRWYFFTNRTTLWKVERRKDDWTYGALLDFTFKGQPQDYDRFLAMNYWKNKYNLGNSSAAKGVSGQYPWIIISPTEKIHAINFVFWKKDSSIAA